MKDSYFAIYDIIAWSKEQRELLPLLILYSITVKASQPFEPISVQRCVKTRVWKLWPRQYWHPHTYEPGVKAHYLHKFGRPVPHTFRAGEIADINNNGILILIKDVIAVSTRTAKYPFYRLLANIWNCCGYKGATDNFLVAEAGY